MLWSIFFVLASLGWRGALGYRPQGDEPASGAKPAGSLVDGGSDDHHSGAADNFTRSQYHEGMKTFEVSTSAHMIWAGPRKANRRHVALVTDINGHPVEATDVKDAFAPKAADAKDAFAPKGSAEGLDELLAQLGGLLAYDVKTRNLEDLREHLRRVGALLKADPGVFDVNGCYTPLPLDQWHRPAVNDTPVSAGSRDQGHRPAVNDTPVSAGSRDRGPSWQAVLPQGAAANRSSGMTLLGATAQAGWLPGAKELVLWNQKRRDTGDRLHMDAGEDDKTPLLLAARAGHAGVVQYLVSCGASVAVRDRRGLTPLETAVLSGNAELVKAFFGVGSELASGLAPLRRRLAREAEALPLFTERWPWTKDRDDGMDSMRLLVPLAFQPSPPERQVVGEQPSAWVLLYKNRVMSELANGPSRCGDASAQVDALLATNDFDSFAHEFSMSLVMLSAVLSFFGLFAYIGFRLKVYGWLETPVSLTDMIPGAFDPLRLRDPDFDPSNQRAELPYRAVKAYVDPQLSQFLTSVVAFVKALLGVFCSWFLQYVRIPPEKLTFDEDYASDDDEEECKRIREQRMAHAAVVRNTEVTLRVAALAVLLWWLLSRAKRWNDAVILLLLYFYYAWFVAWVARSTLPAPQPEPERTPDDDDTRHEDIDAALVVCALFTVQYGPRWTRSIGTTRSTAQHMRNARAANRRRDRRGRLRQSEDGGVNTDTSGTEMPQAEEVAPAPRAAVSEVATDDSVVGRFQKLFIQSGLLHITHGAFLEGAISSIIIITLSMLWLFHLRKFSHGSFCLFYDGMSPTELFEAYGAPGTPARFAALALELSLLVLAGERLYGIASLAHVTSLTLRQRSRALLFVRNNLPIGDMGGHEHAIANVHDAVVRLDDCVRCAEFALELSSVRWVMLQEPIMVVYLCALKFLAIALFGFLMRYVKPYGLDLTAHSLLLDPTVPLCVGLCITWPLVTALAAAAAANQEVMQLREQLRLDADAAVTATEGSKDLDDDVEFVQLRVKSCEALQSSRICWPTGREVGCAEVVVLACVAIAAGGMALARFRDWQF